jgi:hypothetical protein
MRRHLALALAAAATVALAAVPSGAAYAQTRTKHDPVGDTTPYGGTYHRSDDIVKFRVSYTRKSLVLTTWMRELKRNGADFYIGVVSEGYRGYTVHVSAGRKVKHQFTWFADDEGGKQACRGLKVNWNVRQDSVTAKIPMSCTERLKKKLWASAQVNHGIAIDDAGTSIKRS